MPPNPRRRANTASGPRVPALRREDAVLEDDEGPGADYDDDDFSQQGRTSSRSTSQSTSQSSLMELSRAGMSGPGAGSQMVGLGIRNVR